MGPRTVARHARPLAVERWTSRIAERGPARPPSAASGPPTATEAARRGDPLLDPLAVTEHCVIGDQIRLPAARCDIVGCGAEFADLAALGEAHNRARALAAGWAADECGRLVCPACQAHHGVTQPRITGPEPDTGGGPAPAAVPPGPSGEESPAAGGNIAGPPGTVIPGRHRRARWLHMLAALASGDNGWTAAGPGTFASTR